MHLIGEMSHGEGWEGTRRSHSVKGSRHCMMAAKQANLAASAKALQEIPEIRIFIQELRNF